MYLEWRNASKARRLDSGLFRALGRSGVGRKDAPTWAWSPARLGSSNRAAPQGPPTCPLKVPYTMRGPPALVAQRIEHLTTDQKVGGSSPSERARSEASTPSGEAFTVARTVANGCNSAPKEAVYSVGGGHA
jgi:hypothetical protein